MKHRADISCMRPYFPLREFYYAEACSLLGEAGESEGALARWIDETALNGDRFLRIETKADASTFRRPVQWKGTGTLRLRLRSRQMTPGTVRLIAADNTTFFETKISPQTEWGGFSFSLPAQEGGAWLEIEPKKAAQWDLRSLEYCEFDRDAWLADLREREAAGHPANLLPHSRFPLGLPQGWTIDRNSCPADGLELSASESMLGTSGVPTLRIAASGQGWLRSAPFVAWPDSASPDEPLPHVASLWIAGEGVITLRVLEGTRNIAEQIIQASSEGATVKVPFSPPVGDTPLCLELQWSESLPGVYLDAVRVVPAACFNDSQIGRFPVEVAIACRNPEALHIAGEPFLLRAYISDAERGTQLRVIATDLYGQSMEQHLTLTGPGLIDFELNDSHLAPLGSYRIHACAPRSGIAEIIAHRLPATRFAERTAPESRFGVHVLPTQRHLRIAAAVGLKWVRLHGPGSEINYWWDVEREPGNWKFRSDRLARFREAGFSVLGKFTSTPRWASGQTEVVHTYFDQFVAPKDLDAWRKYVARMLAEYDIAIDVYEIWNEPWLDKFFSARVELQPDGSRLFVGLPDPAAAYADLSRVTREALDAAQYHPPLIGLNTTTNRNVDGWIDGDEWTRLARASGALDQVDMLSYHDYSGAADPFAQFDLSRREFNLALGPELDDNGHARQPVWNTEGSPQPEGVSPGLYQAMVPDCGDNTETVWEEAERLVRYFLGQFSSGVEKAFLYTMHNALGFTSDNSFSVLLAPDATLHPSGAALAALAQAVDPLPFAGISDVQGGRLLQFAAADGTRATEVFLADTYAPDALPPDREDYSPWQDLFGNPAQTPPAHGATFYREKNL